MIKLTSTLGAFVIAFLILFVSLFHAASIQYASGIQTAELKNRAEGIDVVYGLPYPGNIGPQSPLWPVKAMRDRVVLSMKVSDMSRAEELLLLSNKRLVSGHHLWELEDESAALSVFSKAEMYLSEATEILEDSEPSDDYLELATDISHASLKHRQILEQVLAESSDTLRPHVTEIMNASKLVYTKTHALLTSEGRVAPLNPFAD